MTADFLTKAKQMNSLARFDLYIRASGIDYHDSFARSTLGTTPTLGPLIRGGSTIAVKSMSILASSLRPKRFFCLP